MNSLVSSKLDYCNSLYHKLPACSLNRLQVVQNALARVVVPSVKRSHHIPPTLRRLHWLPIKQRIDYKIASLTFKTFHFNQPSYLAELLIIETPSRSLLSFSQHKLNIPFIKSKQSERAFAFAAPTIWNSLPPLLRTCTSITTFHALLKTHFFPP